MIKAGVIGHPIAHSRSPVIHGYWLKKFGLPGTYERMDVLPEDLPQFLKNMNHNGWVGCNVTVPHKELACHYVDELDDRVRRSGSLNTIYLKNGKSLATSTDGMGFVANVKSHAPHFAFAGATVTLLGAGGSARAIVDEVLRLGASQVFLHNRTFEKAAAVAEAFGSSVTPVNETLAADRLRSTDLLVNTTSAGIANAGTLAVSLSRLPKHTIVADINYVPLITPFLQEAEQLGLTIVPGLGMLLHQAVVGFEKWFGIMPEVTKELHDLVARDIDSGFQT